MKWKEKKGLANLARIIMPTKASGTGLTKVHCGTTAMTWLLSSS